MAGSSDTLNISSIRLKKDYPIADMQAAEATRPADPERNPHAAAEARARIAALPQYHPLAHPHNVPVAPTTDLILDKQVLAGAAAKAAAVKRPGVPSALAPLLTAAGIFLLVLLLFKAPVIFNQAKYSFGQKNAAAPVVASATEVVPAENTITIAKINVHAPVVYEPSIQEAAIQKSLQSGVVHYGNTAKPGEVGNTAIFGHSSNDWWEPGNFKFVFVLLDKLAPGDQITVDYQSQRYVYEVTGSKIVEPTNVGVLNPTKEPTLTLITCTPPGTSLKRLVVTAKQISPNPSTATKVATTATDQTQPGTLASSAPSFMDQVANAFKGVTSGIGSLFGGSADKPADTSSQLPSAK